jgi:EpsD family peptidyl-prolyl cis-trans isomerase
MDSRLSALSSPLQRRRYGAASSRVRLVCHCVVAAVIANVLGACGQGNDNPPSGQVVAKVNGQEITVHQVKSEFSALGSSGTTPEAVPGKRVLDSLIDEQLLFEKGKEHQLDHDPQVMQAIEGARRQIIVKAMQADLTAGLPQPAPADVRAFYDANPALFARRRIYTFHQFVIDRAHFSHRLKARLDRARSREAILAALKAENVTYREFVSTRSAEQLPMVALPVIAAMHRGDITAINDGGETTILQLVDFVEHAVTIREATPLIVDYLLSTKKRELVAERLKALRATARIEYMGPFAEPTLQTARGGRPIQAAEAHQSTQSAQRAGVEQPASK